MVPAALTTLTMMALLGATDPAARPGVAEGRPGPANALASLEEEQSSLFARVAPSVVLLVRDGASGSGFVVGPDGLVLTNAHVVGEAQEVAVQLSDGRYGRGRVVARATGPLDLALVQIPFHDVPPLPAGEPAALRAGAYAATVGHGGGAAWTFSTGLIANPHPLGDGAPMLLAQMALRPGSSGGPLVDRRGRAVGIVTAGTRDASGVTFAIRADAAAAAFPQLAPWIAAAGRSPSSPAVAPPPSDAAVAAAPLQAPVERPVDVARLSASGASMPTWGPQTATRPPEETVTVWEAPRSVRQARPGASPQRPTSAQRDVDVPRPVQQLPPANAPPRAAVYVLMAFALVSGGVATGAYVAGRSHSH
jgi:S1-C subfamily serine protease